MYTHPQHGDLSLAAKNEAAHLRKEVGKKLKELRQDVELTQRDLADKVGMAYYTMISQIENGKTRVPPEAMEKYAEALKVPKPEFGKLLLRHYDPKTYWMIFEE